MIIVKNKTHKHKEQVKQPCTAGEFAFYKWVTGQLITIICLRYIYIYIYIYIYLNKLVKEY